MTPKAPVVSIEKHHVHSDWADSTADVALESASGMKFLVPMHMVKAHSNVLSDALAIGLKTDTSAASVLDHAIQLPDASDKQVAGLLDHMRNEPIKGQYPLTNLLEIFDIAEKLRVKWDQVMLARLCIEHMGKDPIVGKLYLPKLDADTVKDVEKSFLVALVRGFAKYGDSRWANGGHMDRLDWRGIAQEFQP